MKEPFWLPSDALSSIHNELLNRFGGSEGIRDEGMFDSAVNRPKQLFNYSQPSLFELAAAYAFGIIKNHPYVDGNKRTGFMAAYTFLLINGQELHATEVDAVLQTLALAAGELEEAGYANWLEANCRPATD